MTLINSNNVLLQDIYINSTNLKGGDQFGPLNTDGADTIYSNNITFARWTVDCGDDNISQKANSTNIWIEDCTFYHGSGIALGSIGQFKDQYEFIENVTARNIEMHGPIRQGGYIKTWTGVQKGFPPNGGKQKLCTLYTRDLLMHDFFDRRRRSRIYQRHHLRQLDAPRRRTGTGYHAVRQLRGRNRRL